MMQHRWMCCPVALFDRAADRLSVAATRPLIEHPDLPCVLDAFNVGV